MRRVVLLCSMLMFLGFAVAEENRAQTGKSDVEYLELQPHFTVNLAENRRYLLVKAQLLVDGGAIAERVKTHLPMLRHELIMLFSGLPADSLATAEQREALRLKARRTVSEALDRYGAGDGFRDIFFTEFLVD